MVKNVKRKDFQEFPQKMIVSVCQLRSRVRMLRFLNENSFCLKEQQVKSKARVSCEENRIGATGVGVLPLTRTNICVGARTAQAV